MRKAIVLSVVLAVSGSGLAGNQAQPPSVAPQPLTLEGTTTYVYRTVGSDELRLHVFKSSFAAPQPAIVFFFGGGWTNGSIRQFVPQAEHFAKRGMVAIVADYRVFGRHGTNAFEAMADARAAIRWVRSHTSELGVDPNRIVAAGGSAGGHVALSAAVFDAPQGAGEDRSISAKPNVLVLFNPAVDTTGASGTVQDRFDHRGQDGSPLHHVRAGLPPTLIMHGKADTTVPYADVERFCAEATRAGNECQLVGYDGAVHGFFNPPNADGKWFRETLMEADRFLTRLGYLRPPSLP